MIVVKEDKTWQSLSEPSEADTSLSSETRAGGERPREVQQTRK